jgi:hypothetical protein
VTDRNFYSHLPTPERTEASDLSKYIAKESKESKKEKGGFGTADNNSNKNKGKAGKGDDGAMLAKVFGRTEPCKVKCIQVYVVYDGWRMVMGSLVWRWRMQALKLYLNNDSPSPDCIAASPVYFLL